MTIGDNDDEDDIEDFDDEVDKANELVLCQTVGLFSKGIHLGLLCTVL